MLIERQAVIDAICYEWCYATYDSCPHRDEEDYMCDGCDDIKIIESLPSAERTERTGRWEAPYVLKDGSIGACCSQCGAFLPVICDYRNFCPNCGARMLNGGE